MPNVIGDWPDGWEINEVGTDPAVKESESDGDFGVRVIPNHLADVEDVEAGAVLVQHVEEQVHPGETREYWNIAIQSQHGILGEEGMRGYVTRWSENELNRSEALDLIDGIVADLQDIDNLTDLDYINNNIY